MVESGMLPGAAIILECAGQRGSLHFFSGLGMNIEWDSTINLELTLTNKATCRDIGQTHLEGHRTC